MKKGREIVGERFGKLLVLEYIHKNSRGDSYYLCECECGNKKEVKRKYLIGGDTKSCGCLRREHASKIQCKTR